MTDNIWKRSGIEALGTFWLVLGGCGSAIFAAKFPQTGIGFAGVALAFGLTVVTFLYAFGRGQLNPAVTVAAWAARRLPGKDVLPYIVAQVLGSALAAVLIYLIASGSPGFSLASGFAANGYGEHSPGGYSMGAAFLAEATLTAMFAVVCLGATSKSLSPTLAPFAPFAIGLCLTLIHLISIPITNTSVNPARSTGPALIAQGWALEQLWMFWVAPLAGAAVAGVLYGLAEHGARLPQAARTA